MIDEFPYLVRSSPELPSLLQAMVDAPDSERVPLLLYGSSQRWYACVRPNLSGLNLGAAAALERARNVTDDFRRTRVEKTGD